MTQSYRLMQVDVFTAAPFLGNPVAVVFGADALDTATMQRIANWTNLSETTFVCTPTDPAADYALRIFTPRGELPFAGHPTLGSAYALLSAGIVAGRDGRIIQQCTIGLVEVAVPDDWRRTGVSFRLPRYSVVTAPIPDTLLRALANTAPSDAAEGGSAAEVASAVAIASGVRGTATSGASVAQPAFGFTPAIVDVGPRWVVAELADDAAVRGLSPDFAALAAYDRDHATTGLTVFGIGGGGDGAIVVRSFAPADGINEDPVCGSGNAAVAAYRLSRGEITADAVYVASQGREVGRDGRVFVQIRDGDVHIGGQCVVCIEGVITA